MHPNLTTKIGFYFFSMCHATECESASVSVTPTLEFNNPSAIAKVFKALGGDPSISNCAFYI